MNPIDDDKGFPNRRTVFVSHDAGDHPRTLRMEGPSCDRESENERQYAH